MTTGKTMTFCIMDGPFEQSRTVTAMRIIDAALRSGNHVNVFAYEGAVGLSFAHQQKHANAVHGRDVTEEDHPLSREWIGSLFALARERGVEFNWSNCGLCLDERGLGDAIDGCRRGTPADLHTWATSSDNTLIIGTR